MVSAYDMYSFFFKAVIMGIFVILGYIRIIVIIIKMIKKRNASDNDVLFVVIGLIVGLTFFSSVYSRLVKGNGLQFLMENEVDVVTRAGVVQTYVESERVSDHGYPKDVVIDDELYLWMSKEYVPEGSIVEITYMPQSKVILKMDVLKKADYWQHMDEIEPHREKWTRESYAVYAWRDIFIIIIGLCCIMSLNIFRVRHMEGTLLMVMSIGVALMIIPAYDLTGKDWHVAFSNENIYSKTGVVSNYKGSREVFHWKMMEITVGGTAYAFPAFDGIKPGDYVEIEYWPTSRYLASIYVEPRISNNGDIRANQYYKLHVENTGSDAYNISYELMDMKKDILHAKNICARNIMFSMVNDELVKVSVKYGEGEDTVYSSYFNVQTGELSDEFVGVVYQDDKYVAYFANDELVVRDIFDDNVFYQEVDMRGKDIDHGNPCIAIEKSEEGDSVLMKYRDAALRNCNQIIIFVP